MADSRPDAPTPPKGMWGSILTSTPIVLTVLATAFAGLSSSEMTRSMYFRSVAAQEQSKAGDQWSFFQAKRIRGTSLETTVELIQGLSQPDPFDAAQVEAGTAQMLQELEKTRNEKNAADAVGRLKAAREKFTKLLADEKTSASLLVLSGGALPKIEPTVLPDKATQEKIDAVVKAIAQRKMERETAAQVAALNPDDIEEAIRNAENDADKFDKACEPINDAMKGFRTTFAELSAAVKPVRGAGAGAAPAGVGAQADRLANGFRAAALDFDARRYRQESFYNRKAAELYEVRVRRSAVESDRHRERSKLFFYSMLVAQLGVTISSLAVARQQRSLLWLVAALAGVVSLGFTAYVYMSY